ncbi:hypothetical protein JRQ81_018907 [Phrynocephalus forsythii]|uniref:DDE Tnp4 domain-containing protein n=1 Tax=Phrynocephalus forsythii TaxID=171643 RepID=A0A9Q0XQG0_9SAUR|nr:hypothetical protein JRQ81_018907 [Phrynocephalus forsythii]
MPCSRLRSRRNPLLHRNLLLAVILQNVNIILNSISLLRCRRCDNFGEDSSELHHATDALVQSVFWAVAEWRKTSPMQKLCWCYPGRSAWFHNTVLECWDYSQWLENFRMTHRTLFKIADLLRPYLMRKDTVMQSAIPVEQHVAIGVYFLASRSCYRKIALVFQKGTSTVASVVVEVCLAIEHTLLKEEVRVSDINKSSMLFKKMEEGTLIPGNPMFQYGGVSIPPLILGDGAYPLCKWLMKPYAVPRNERERHYNKMFNRSRNVVECAFGWLKARFRRLSVRMEAHIQNVNSIIASAVILHNICEKKKHDSKPKSNST